MTQAIDWFVRAKGEGPLIGRAALLESALSDLNKPTPDNLQFVGPALSGKTVFLRALHTAYAQQENDSVAATIFWATYHERPKDNDSFMRYLADKLRQALTEEIEDISDIRGDAPEDQIDFIKDELVHSGKHVIIMIDGIDDLLATDVINRQTLDYLASLIRAKALVFVTGSRTQLQEACARFDARTSELFLLFQNPVTIGALSANDWLAFTQKISTDDVNAKAADRLQYWAGNSPRLASILCHEVIKQRTDSAIDVELIDACAKALLQSADDIKYVWRKLSDDHGVIDRLIRSAKGRAAQTNFGQKELRKSLETGITKLDNKDVVVCSQLIRKFAADQVSNRLDLEQSFPKDKEGFTQTVLDLLRLRLDRAQGVAKCDKLRRKIRSNLGVIEDDPKDYLLLVRSIVEFALDVIWDSELGDDVRTIPNGWLQHWKSRIPAKTKEIHTGKIPTDRGTQIRYLRWAAGASKQKLERQLKFLSYTAVTLLSNLQDAGNLGNHYKESGSPPLDEYVLSIAWTSVALYEQLCQDLANTGVRHAQ